MRRTQHTDAIIGGAILKGKIIVYYTMAVESMRLPNAKFAELHEVIALLSNAIMYTILISEARKIKSIKFTKIE